MGRGMEEERMGESVEWLGKIGREIREVRGDRRKKIK